MRLARSPGPVTEALCWSHARRKFFVLADIAASAKRGAKKGKAGAIIAPLAFEAVTRIDALFDVEREINRLSAEGRLTVRAERSAPLLAELEAWLRAERARLSRHAPVAKAMDYMLKRWPGFARFLEDGRVCLTNNAAERALRGIALGRKAWLFAGSDRGGHRAAFMYTLIVTAENQRRRSSGLARRRARSHRRPFVPAPRRAPPLELEARPGRRHTSRITHVPRCCPTSRAKSKLTAVLAGWVRFKSPVSFAF